MKAAGPTFILSTHAETVLVERGIPIEWIRLAISSPDLVVADRNDVALVRAYRRIGEFGDRVLRVVYDPKHSPVRVVTAFFDRAAKDLIS